MKRLPTTDPNAPEVPQTPPERFVFNAEDPAVKRLIAAGIPVERLIAADMTTGPTYED